MNEEWKPVAGYEDQYEVSNLGRIRRRHGRILHPSMNTNGPSRGGGYLYLNMHDGVSKPRKGPVHQLVATAFHGACPLGHEVNHIDNNRANNRADNLNYLTRSQNAKRAYDQGRRPRPQGERHPFARLTANDVREIRRRVADGEMQKDLAAAFSVHDSHICKIVSRKKWTHI